MTTVRLSVWILLPLLLAACRSDRAAPPRAEGEPVPVEDLQALYPEAIRNLPRVSTGGELEGALGFQVSRAVSRYGANIAENKPFVILSVLDAGSPEMARNMGFAWGFRSTDVPDGRATLSQLSMEPTVFDGHPARRTTDDGSLRKDIEVLVGQRFVVEAHGTLVDADVLDDAVRALDLDRLAALAR